MPSAIVGGSTQFTALAPGSYSSASSIKPVAVTSYSVAGNPYYLSYIVATYGSSADALQDQQAERSRDSQLAVQTPVAAQESVFLTIQGGDTIIFTSLVFRNIEFSVGESYTGTEAKPQLSQSLVQNVRAIDAQLLARAQAYAGQATTAPPPSPTPAPRATPIPPSATPLPPSTAPGPGAIFPPAAALVLPVGEAGGVTTVIQLSTQHFGGPVNPAVRTEYDIAQSPLFYRVDIFRSLADATASYRWQGASIPTSLLSIAQPAAAGERLYLSGNFLVATLQFRNVELFVDEQVAPASARSVQVTSAAIARALTMERLLLNQLQRFASRAA